MNTSCQVYEHNVSVRYAALFGALMAPTDPGASVLFLQEELCIYSTLKT